MTERWQKLELIFNELLALPDQERGAHLERSTTGDAALLEELRALLEADVDARRFLESPPALARELRQAITGRFLEGHRLGSYLLEGLLQEGGMGLVFRATDSRNGRTVALKLLPPETAACPDSMKQMQREAEALRAISHPAVVQLIESGESSGLHYIVMEFVEGRTLRAALAEGAITDPEGIARQLVAAAAVIDRAGLVHGDIKPENIMITPEGQLRVIDFGLTLNTTPGSLRATVNALGLAGTIGYSAPERIRGEPATSRSDVFAAGCVIFEILTGRPLFQGKTPWALAEAILRGCPGLDGMGGVWRPLVARCVDNNPRRRFAGPAAMEAAYLRPGGFRRWFRVAAACLTLAASLIGVQWYRSPAHPGVPLGTGVDSLVSVSADGRIIAFSRRDPRHQAHSRIEIADMKTGKSRPVTEGPFEDRFPSLAPDGSAVFFESNREPPGIYRMPLKRAGAAPELAIPGGFRPRVSPDGKKLVYLPHRFTTADPDGDLPGVTMVSISPGYPQRWSRTDLVAFNAPVWKPDSSAFAIKATNTKRPEKSTGAFFIVSAMTGVAVEFRGGDLVEVCGWGRQADVPGLFHHADNLPEFGSVVLTGGAQTPGQGERGAFASCVNQGAELWGVRTQSTSKIFSIPLDPITERPRPAAQITVDDRWPGALYPSLSEDGAFLLFQIPRTDQRTGGYHMLVDQRTGEGRVVFDGPLGQAPILAPDAAAVLTGSHTDGVVSWQVFSYPSLQVMSRSSIEYGITWDLGHGGELQLTPTRGVPRGVEAHTVRTGETRVILSDPGRNLYLADLSSDERWVVFVSQSPSGAASRLYAAPFHRDRATPMREWVDLGEGDYPRWSVSGRTVYYLDGTRPRSELRALPVDPLTKRPTGPASAVYTFGDEWTAGDIPAGTFRITVSRDRLAFALGRRETWIRRE